MLYFFHKVDLTDKIFHEQYVLTLLTQAQLNVSHFQSNYDEPPPTMPPCRHGDLFMRFFAQLVRLFHPVDVRLGTSADIGLSKGRAACPTDIKTNK